MFLDAFQKVADMATNSRGKAKNDQSKHEVKEPIKILLQNNQWRFRSGQMITK